MTSTMLSRTKNITATQKYQKQQHQKIQNVKIINLYKI